MEKLSLHWRCESCHEENVTVAWRTRETDDLEPVTVRAKCPICSVVLPPPQTYRTCPAKPENALVPMKLRPAIALKSSLSPPSNPLTESPFNSARDANLKVS